MRSDTITMEAEIKELKAELAALRAKADAFDWLATAKERIDIHPVPNGTFAPDHGFFTLWVRQGGKRYCYEAPTLAEAVRLAMEAEGER